MRPCQYVRNRPVHQRSSSTLWRWPIWDCWLSGRMSLAILHQTPNQRWWPEWECTDIGLSAAKHFLKGPYIKDVRTGRGEGGSPKADIVREVAWIYSYRSSQNADKGGGGPKSRKFCGRPLWMVPWLACKNTTDRKASLLHHTVCGWIPKCFQPFNHLGGGWLSI